MGDVVGQVGERWRRRSLCPVWDARGVLEHVIGFHKVLLLRPADVQHQLLGLLGRDPRW